MHIFRSKYRLLNDAVHDNKLRIHICFLIPLFVALIVLTSLETLAIAIIQRRKVMH
jgi:hypothetical protein